VSDSPALWYVLQRLNWARHGTTPAGYPEIERMVRLPGAVRLGSFEREADALTECARLEEQTRRAVNPFCCNGSGLPYQTRFAEAILCDWLLDADISPPDPGENGRDWVGWWVRAKGALNEAQWRHVWQAFDRVVFHEVMARERKPIVYVVAEVGWVYNDQGYDPRPEGSLPVKAFRSREKAEAERQLREAEARRNYAYLSSFDRFDVNERLRRQQPFATDPVLERPDVNEPDYPLFFEIIEVEVDNLPGAGR
jgi:hypothetical protein